MHNSLPLAILNYSKRCQYEPGLWTALTLQCRGLIYDTESLKIVARPFRKFFNYGEPHAPRFNMTDRCAVQDKLDGLLGILYPTGPEQFAVATRGSFHSPQAEHATELWRTRYAHRVTLSPDYTLLFEIIAPQFRIVVNYGAMNDLVLLGAVNRWTGRSITAEHTHLRAWPGPRAEWMMYTTFGEALALPPRTNREGVVVHFLESDERLKIKYDDYVRLHRVVTGLNQRTVWQHLAERRPLEELLDGLPDEFHGWATDVAVKLRQEVQELLRLVEQEYAAVLQAVHQTLPIGTSSREFRKEFAARVQTHPLRSYLFARLSHHSVEPMAWKAVMPSGE
jgi:RNA ligase